MYDQPIPFRYAERTPRHRTAATAAHAPRTARRDGCKRNLHASRDTYAAGATLETPLDGPRSAKPRLKREIPISTEYDAPDLPVPSHREDRDRASGERESFRFRRLPFATANLQ